MKRTAAAVVLITALTGTVICHAEDMSKNAIYHIQKARQWSEFRDYDAAIRELQIAIRLQPGTALTATAYNNMGLAYLKTGQYPQAVVSFQEAVSLNPQMSLYYDNLAKAYGASGKNAGPKLRKAALANPDNLQAHYLLGMVEMRNGNTAAAEKAFNTFIKLSPHSALADAARLRLESLRSGQIPPE